LVFAAAGMGNAYQVRDIENLPAGRGCFGNAGRGVFIHDLNILTKIVMAAIYTQKWHVSNGVSMREITKGVFPTP
jgi:hypothetical protein